jgi:hypothetical protein
MKKTIYLIFFLPTILFAQSGIEVQSENNSYNYMINIGQVVMCPYLGPKMIKHFNGMGAKNIVKNDSLETLTFDLDSLYPNTFIEDIFIDVIGIPKWSIFEIKILENES